MNKLNPAGYKDIMDDMSELFSKYTIVEGYIDIFDPFKDPNDKSVFIAKDFDKKMDWWVIGSFVEDKMIIETFNSYEFDVKSEGCYKFKAILTYESDFDSDGRCITRGWMVIEHIDMDFQYTFEQRDREDKLNRILDIEFDTENIFNIKIK